MSSIPSAPTPVAADVEKATSTRQKALALNLDAKTYGTFAEIGAGQEVARWFFSVGGAAGTVAKTISAYDMAVSDALYGSTPRYVSRERLEAMLEHEFVELRHGLEPGRGDAKTFFAFADTVTTGSYRHPGPGRGWLGVRFQTRPHEEPSEVIVHAHLRDRTAVRQQEALGVLGVNLIHAAFYRRQDPADLIAGLLDELSRERVEIDMIKLSGPAFAGIDNRLMSLQLVERALTDAAMFTASGEVVQPSEVLHNKPILVERGSFRPATKLTLDLLERARDQFLQEQGVRGQQPVVLAEMTLRSLISEPDVGHPDFLARTDVLRALGFDVLVSRFGPYYELVEYLADYTNGMIGLAIGLPGFQASGRREVLHRPARRRPGVGRSAVQTLGEDVRVSHPRSGHRRSSLAGTRSCCASLAPPARTAARDRSRRTDSRLRGVLPVDPHAGRAGPNPERRRLLGADGAGRRCGDHQGGKPLRLASQADRVNGMRQGDGPPVRYARISVASVRSDGYSFS